MPNMTPKRFAQAEQEITLHAHEVIAHLCTTLSKMAPFRLVDGTPVTVKTYQAPEINEQGEAQCGVDIILPNGHLEFTVRNTGWGKSFANTLTSRRRGRER